MAVPDFQEIMLPLLKFASDGQEHSIREGTEYISRLHQLSDAERRERLPSGQQTVVGNRVGWARTYLKKAGLLESTKRAHFRITNLGLSLLAEKPDRIDITVLRRFPPFLTFIGTRGAKVDVQQPQTVNQEDAGRTPQELLEYSYERMQRDLVEDLIGQVKQCSPEFFERLVVDVLIGMGYGGSQKDAGEAIGRSGDGGIDGIIKEDRLGLDVIYVQAKRWEGPVGSKEIRNFVGSLVGRNANKGVFITSSSFTRDARDYVNSIGHKVILIDGDMLAQLMVDHDVGVSTVETYPVKSIDMDYFAED